MSEQAGGRLSWQLPVSSLISPGVLALSPLSVYSLGSPDTSRVVEIPARVQQSQSCNHISFADREKEQMLGAGKLLWAGDGVLRTDVRRTHVGTMWPTTQVALDATSRGQGTSTHNINLERPGQRDEAQQQSAVISPGKTQG